MNTCRKVISRLRALAWMLAFPLAWGLVGASCSGAGTGGSANGGPIVGTWQLTSFSYEAQMDIEGMAGTVAGVGRGFDDVLVTFKADGTTATRGAYVVDITIAMAGYSSTQSIPTKPSVLDGGTWEIDGDILITNHPDNPAGPTPIIIKKLDGNTLHLNATMPPPMPVPGLSDITADIRFARVAQ